MINLRTLGALELSKPNGTEACSVLTQPKRLALLAYLTVASPQGFHRRDTLLGLLWPDLDEEHARSALSQAIYYLRRSLGREVVRSRGNEEVAIDRDRLWCDAVVFRQALAAGAAGEALELYRGDLLPGFFLSNALEFERWLEEERAHLRSCAAEAAWTLAESAGAGGSAVDAAHWGRRALALTPGDEAQLRRLLVLLDRVGDRARAVQAYEEFAERFARDYEIEPSSETQALITAVRSREEPVEQNSSHVRDESAGAAERSLELSPSRGHLDAVASEDEHSPAREDADHTPTRRVRPKRRVVVGGITALVASLLLSAPFLWPRVQSNGAPEPLAGTGSLVTSRLAILPLANYSPDPQDEYFADGMTEELISRLSKLRDLRVIARTSVMPYKESEKSVAEIAGELRVGTVLEGSVRKAGNRVRITVQLVDAQSQEHLWSEDYDAELADVLAVQSEIAERVAEALQLKMWTRERHHLSDRATQSADAYTEYLKGRYFLGKLDGSSFRKARDHFQLALDLDPTFSQAWSGLSDAYNQLTDLSVLRASEGSPRARAAAERALELDPDLAEAHASLASVLSMYDWDNEVSERHFRRALMLDPSSARAHRMYASHLRNQGRFDEALAEVRTAQELDPLFAFPRLEEGIILYLTGQHDAAIAECRQLLATAPTATHPYLLLALAYAQREQYEEALAALEHADPQRRQPDAHGIRGHIYAKTGRHEDARQILRTLDARASEQPISSFHKAVIYVGLGEPDRALDMLERTAEERTWKIRLLKVEPIFDPLRSEPRFQALLERVGLAG